LTEKNKLKKTDYKPDEQALSCTKQIHFLTGAKPAPVLASRSELAVFSIDIGGDSRSY
jgi:hypothetical protein